jgi:hypothetical protein
MTILFARISRYPKSSGATPEEFDKPPGTRPWIYVILGLATVGALNN